MYGDQSDYQKELFKNSGKTYTCDSCGWEAQGYERRALEGDGWKWNEIPGTLTHFVMCDSCEQKYKTVRYRAEQLREAMDELAK